MDRRDPTPEVARAWGESPVPKAILGFAAAIYLLAVFAEAAKSGTAAKYLPAPIAYFTQVAALFPHASRHAIDYRVEAFRCKDGAWIEIDPHPWFPIDADNKENRFYRTMHFYGDAHPHRQTLRAIDDFIFTHYNDAVRGNAAAGRGATDPIGGVRFTKVTTPFGNPGEGSARYAKLPLAEYPEGERKVFYYSPESKREERCKRIGP
ncbi:Hypothetical protein A7982_10178 [Minicystis rosea]|nr:Hypothetical protein A7982_10178 [Minicystis rosea]